MNLLLDVISPIPEFSVINDNKIILSSKIVKSEENKLSDSIIPAYQKINNDDGNYVQKDPIIYKHINDAYIFWSDQRNGNYEIYFSKGTEQSNLLGDVNQDFVIDVLDVIILVQVVLGNSDNTDNADLNDDAIINIQDAIMLINIILEN